MRKNFVKAIAVACALSMLATPITTLANSVGSTGSGVVENDNSILPNLSRVTLPTINDATYDFTIDVEGLLPGFSDKYDDAANVYFNAIETDATLAAADGTSKLYIASKAEVTTVATDIEANLATKTDAEANTFLADYYVWQPDYKTNDDGSITRTGNGKFATLTINFFDVTYDTSDTTKIATATLKEFGNSGNIDTIFNKKVYKMNYAEVTTANMAEALTFLTKDASGAMTFSEVDNKSLMVSADATTTTPVAATLYTDANTSGNVKYTEPVYEYTNTSNIATIVNKSTFDIAMTTTVTVSDNHGINFVAGTTDLTTSTTNDMNLAIKLADDSHSTDVAADTSKASASYVLTGTGTDSTTLYKGEDTDIDEATGSQNYYRYINPNLAGSSVQFAITAAAAATTEGAKTAWETYVTGLGDGTYTKPSINVVYSWEEVAQDATTDTLYKSTAGSEYTIADATASQEDYWVTSATIVTAPGFASYSPLTFTKGTALTVNLNRMGTLQAVGFTSETNQSGEYTGKATKVFTKDTDYTVSSDGYSITFPADSGILATSSANGGTTCSLLVNISGTLYAIPLTINAASVAP